MPGMTIRVAAPNAACCQCCASKQAGKGAVAASPPSLPLLQLKRPNPVASGATAPTAADLMAKPPAAADNRRGTVAAATAAPGSDAPTGMLCGAWKLLGRARPLARINWSVTCCARVDRGQPGIDHNPADAVPQAPVGAALNGVGPLGAGNRRGLAVAVAAAML